MRWISILLIIGCLSSCTALKPVVAKRDSAAPPTQARQPEFIETISVDPTPHQGRLVKPAVAVSAPAGSLSLAEDLFSPMQFKYAILMDVPVEDLGNLKLFSFIDDWYGTPYRFGGDSKDGIDCSAFAGNLLTAVYDLGLPRMAKAQYKATTRVKRSDLEEGDLVFFHTTRKGISHVGVYLGNNKFVHASVAYGVTISDLNDAYYSRCFRSGGRVKQTGSIVAGN